MLEAALHSAKNLKLTVKITCKVPGVFDMPLIIEKILRRSDIDGIVTLGAVIKGQTKHDEVIAHSTATTIVQLSLKYSKPISLGITGPGMKEREAYARIRPVSERAVEAVKKISDELKKI